MSKKIVGLTGLLLFGCLIFLGLQIFYYTSSPKDTKAKEVRKIELELKKTEEQIQEKEKEKQTLEKEKALQIELYQVWEKVVKTS